LIAGSNLTVDALYRIFGPPHELLHILALLLIGRRPKAVSSRYVDIPNDLSTPAYVFVAGLPALVFWGAALAALLAVVNSQSIGSALIAFVVFTLAAVAGFGTLGDIQLILRRLRQ